MNGYYESTPQNAITVSELNYYLKQLLESDPIVRHIYVRGEISNYKRQYTSGHLYFALKDSDGVVRSVMFRSSAQKLAFEPESGMKVIAGGKVSIYGKSGDYQLYVDSMIPDGIGSMYLAYEQLKNKLSAEGLFDPSHKLPLPVYPKKIGIVTSPTGAAIRDMINIIGRRYPLTSIELYPSMVQGDGACIQLAHGIEYFNTRDDIDVIIIGRGGGSIEDLWEFNSELLARAIYDCHIPVISAVGHETDYTISDFVADKRAPTPSAAAELAVPDSTELKRMLFQRQQDLKRSADNKISLLRSRIESLRSSRQMINTANIMLNRRMDISNLNNRLDLSINDRIKSSKNKLLRLSEKLDALDPIGILSRGYAIVSDTVSNKMITSVKDLDAGTEIFINVSDGKIYATVEHTELNKND